MSPTDIITLNIDEKAHGYAKIYASLLSDEFQRKRAYASIVALYAFINLLEKEPYDIQKAMTLFRNPMLNEQYEISDLYVNNWHLDVRVVTGGDAVLLPKIHFDSDIAADFYIIIKVNSNLSSAELIGIADTSSVKKEAFDYHYLSVAFNNLIGYDEFLNRIKNKKQCSFSPSEHELFRESYLSLMDNELDKELKNKLLKHLFNCSECRTEFCCFTGFEMVSCNMSRYPDLLEDQTLTIVGAQNVDDKKYEGKEETIYIGADKNDDIITENDESETEETVSDILDELFNDNEEEFIANDMILDRPMGASVVEPVRENNSDLNIIEEDDDSADISVSDSNSDEEMQIIYDENSIVSDKKDFEIVDEADTNILKDDIEILGNDDNDFSEDISILSDDIEPVTEKNEAVEDNVQKVIVDYDETGNPVYSYITNVNPEDAESIISEIEPIEDDTFDEYPEDNNSEAQFAKDDNIEILEDISEKYDDNNIEDNNIDYNDSQEQLISEQDDNKIKQTDSDLSSKNSDINDDNAVGYEAAENTDNVSSLQDIEESNEDKEEEHEESEEEYDEYDEYDGEEHDDNRTKNSAKSSSKAVLLILSLLLILGLAGSGAFFFMKNTKNNNVAVNQQPDNVLEIPTKQQTDDMFAQAEENNIDIPAENNTLSENELIPADDQNNEQDNEQNNEQNVPVTGSIEVPPLTEQDLLKIQNTPTGDVNKVIVNAFSKGGSPVSLRGINWLCSAELFMDKTFKAYLQNLDNILKLNLRKNILNATEMPENNSLSIKMAVDNDGNLQKVVVSDSSGSEQIDNIVLQSINETFEGEKSQILSDSAMKSDMYYLKVVIKL